MQEMILILSRCQSRCFRPRTQKTFFRFHFKGFYTGQKIKEIHVYPLGNIEMDMGEDYLLWVKYRAIKQSVLEVSLMKFKKIE